MGYIPLPPAAILHKGEYVVPRGFVTTPDRLTDAQRQAIAKRWASHYSGKPLSQPGYDPAPDLRQALIGYYLIAGLVLTATALVVVLVVG